MIERATIDDVPALIDQWVTLASNQREYGSHVYGTENEATVRRYLGERIVDDRAFVVRDGSEILGFVTVALEESSYRRDVRRGIVENVYVRPDRRGEGLGSALIERAERTLAARGADVVVLESLVDNDAARRLYERLGYEEHRLQLEKPLGSDNH